MLRAAERPVTAAPMGDSNVLETLAALVRRV